MDKYYENRKLILATPEGKKSQRITHWKQQGLIGDYDIIYNRYINNDKCELCKKTYKDNRDKCMEHNHTTGEFRSICCQRCNANMLDKKIQNNNKSGIKNIHYDKFRNYWAYEKSYYGERFRKRYPNKQIALWTKFIHYKILTQKVIDPPISL